MIPYVHSAFESHTSVVNPEGRQGVPVQCHKDGAERETFSIAGRFVM